MNLIELYEQMKKTLPLSDKGTVHDYINTYNSLFEPIKNDVKLILELGVAEGGSMCLWRNYFPIASIIGVDLRPQCKQWSLPEHGMSVILGDVTNRQTFKYINQEIDIIIDDASHIKEQTIASFDILYPKLKQGGLYIIEDIYPFEDLKQAFDSKGIPYDIVDTRNNKNRYQSDDILFIFKK